MANKEFEDGEAENLEAVEIGRPLIHDNVHYGRGTYRVDAETAKALRAKGATAGVAETMRRERERREAEIRGAAKTGGVEAQGGAGEQPGAQSSAALSRTSGAAGGEGDEGRSGFEPSGTYEEKRAATDKVEALEGELPADFPARDKLEAAGVTRYEQLTKLSRQQIDEFPGIGAATVEQIGQRLFTDAEASGK